MKKRFFLTIICLLFTFTIVACNSNKTNSSQSSSNNPSESGSHIPSNDNESNNTTPEVPTEPTKSLNYVKNGNSYIVTGISEDEKHIVIPAEYEGLPVTKIAESAFAYSRHNAEILSVTIPDSITEIERNAFYNRSEMTSVIIGQNSKLTTIGNNAFSGNHSLESIYIPTSVKTIGDSAFNNDGSINFSVATDNNNYRSENGHLIEKNTDTLIRGGQSGEIPQGIKVIAQAAFRNSVNVNELIIPISVTTIGNYILQNSSIKSIRYLGSEDEWNNVEKGKMWNIGNREIEVKFGDAEPSILIVYFSATNNTRNMANYIHNKIGGDIVEIEAAQPYTSQELDYSIPNNRPEVEKAENARPEIALSTYSAIDISKYDTIVIGYPIWWWTAPMIIGTFLEYYDLTGYDIYPFTQSASMNVEHFTNSMSFVTECAFKKGTPTIHDGLFARYNASSVIDQYLQTNGLFL